ncbi:hypothetical protein THAOC_15301 [Thalassiosira oceanica]|uniref:RING-type domain-containing protein n=1 Tax=Thalassiosira oceanica TaxID=159749 RepID=K0SF52_THAOC|nr:hypothetical protein THAOC_15301 [Thalassiosira oceanica]|eukprot:EJK64010.1 hypothetical protein THAOC_15301 [Thalassiosira oceanica]
METRIFSQELDCHLTPILKNKIRVEMIYFRNSLFCLGVTFRVHFYVGQGEKEERVVTGGLLVGRPRRSLCLFVFSEEAMCRGEEKQGAPATLHSPGASTDGPPPIVTEEKLMNSGHELHEGYTCPLCCLPIKLPVVKHSEVKPCCSKTVCNGCRLAACKHGMANTCPFCRTSFPESGAATLALVQKRVDVKDPVATALLADAYYYGDHGVQQDIPRAIELWTEAARLGDLNTHFKLGVIYYKGEGLELDVGRGVRHWRHAAIQGHPLSRHSLAVHEYINGNHELGVQHWMISAKMGCERSLNGIKEMFMKGHATKAQYTAALKGYQTALEETKSPQREEARAFFNKSK